MTTTLTPSIDNAPSSTGIDVPRRLDERRLAGIGALVFASLVITTNVLQGATPATDASAAEVTSYLTDHRAQNVFGTTAYALGALFLLTFTSAFFGRLQAVGRRDDLVWARLGMFGALLIIPTFAVVSATRLILLVGGDEIIGSPELVTLMWRLEMAVFQLNALPVSAAVLGFGIAGARAGLLPRWFARWVPVAACCGVLSAALAIHGLEGSPVGFGGIVPFATWMVLLLTVGIRSLRRA